MSVDSTREVGNTLQSGTIFRYALQLSRPACVNMTKGLLQYCAYFALLVSIACFKARFMGFPINSSSSKQLFVAHVVLCQQGQAFRFRSVMVAFLHLFQSPTNSCASTPLVFCIMIAMFAHYLADILI